MNQAALLLIFNMAIILFQGCSTKVPSDPELMGIDNSYLPSPNISLTIPGLSNCTTSPDNTILLNSSNPVILLIHGCNGSAARFRALMHGIYETQSFFNTALPQVFFHLGCDIDKRPSGGHLEPEFLVIALHIRLLYSSIPLTNKL